VVMLDIDHFKNVNDQFGHDVGDQVLRATTRAVQRVLRTSDTCTRIGGEEFLVICPGTRQEGGLNLAERIRAAIEMNEVQVPGLAPRKVTASLGVSCSADPGIESIDALLKAADEGVYHAKRSGRNRAKLAPGQQGERKSA
jgi:two-component system cell cycle response regulator